MKRIKEAENDTKIKNDVTIPTKSFLGFAPKIPANSEPTNGENSAKYRNFSIFF